MGKNLFLSFTFLLSFCAASGQQAYLPSGSSDYHMLDRIETMSGRLSDRLFTAIRPLSRKEAVSFLEEAKNNHYHSGLSNSDYYNINRTLALNSEWARFSGYTPSAEQRSPLGNIYRFPPDFIRLNSKDFFLAINPVLSLQGAYERRNGKGRFLTNTTQGAEIRGQVKDIIGFYANVTHNYEEPAGYVEDRIRSERAVPGAGRYRKTPNGYEYLRIRAYADIALIRDHVSLTAGYDTHFIGDGYRSLFLSDFSEGAAFARINTRIWKLNYQNLYLILRPQTFGDQADVTGKKYATIHYLSINPTRWLNIGFFESVVFSRNGHFEFGYLNPMIFYRAVERALGSPDKVAIGLNAKALLPGNINVYTQLLINEFTSRELFAGNGYWANKWGIQLGTRYYNAFGISNLDLQAEANFVRPYTFQHYASREGHPIANFSHYNQPLAHPLGAGFEELLATVRYQPLPKLAVDAKAMYYRQGVDTAGSNNGSNILLNYEARSASYGVGIIHGPRAECLLLGLNASYEFYPRLYLDIGGNYRHYQVAENPTPADRTFYFSIGLRLNLERREYVF